MLRTSSIRGAFVRPSFAIALCAGVVFVAASGAAMPSAVAAPSYEVEVRAAQAAGRAGDYAGALAHLEAAEALALAEDGPGSLRAIGTMQDEAAALVALKRPEDAVAKNVAAVGLVERAYGHDDTRAAAARRNLAALYEQLGKHALAYAAYEESAAAFDSLVEVPYRDLVAEFDVAFANVALEVDRYAVSEARTAAARALHVAAAGENSVLAATDLERMGRLDATRGRYDAAILAYRMAERACRASGTACASELVQIETGLADVYSDLGRYGDAEPALRSALLVARTHRDAFSTAYAGASLVSLLFHEGRFPEGYEVYAADIERVMRPTSTAPPTAEPSADPVRDIARDEANVDAAQRAYGEQTRATALALETLGSTYARERRFDDGRRAFDRAARIEQAIPGVADVERASLYRDRARLEHLSGDLPASEANYRHALAIYRPLFGADHEATFGIGDELADVLFERGDFSGARLAFLEATDASLRIFYKGAAYASESDRVDYARSIGDDIYADLMRFCWARCVGDAELTSRALDDTLALKGAIARNVRDLRTRIAAEGGSSTARFDRIVRLRARIATLRYTTGYDDVEGRDRLHALANATNEEEGRLVRDSASFAASRNLATIDWRHVAARLAERDAAVAFARTKRSDGGPFFLAFVIRHRGEPTVVPLLDEATLESAPLAGYRGIIDADQTAGRAPPADARLYDAIWKPLVPSLAGATRVYVAPDGDLTQLSFAVIPDDAGRPLYETYDVRMLSSIGDLVAAAPVLSSNVAGIVVGNPAFNPSSPRRVAPLPGTAREVSDVAALLRNHGWPVRSFVQAAATKETLRRVVRPRVLHIATHGFFIEGRVQHFVGLDITDDDPMLRSGLVLAGKDATLTALEASNLDLRGTQLVVLSACDSGLGSVEVSDGVFGLRRGFHEAGAAAVMMSMWPVPDRETHELMNAFYRNWLAGSEMHLALANAMTSERRVVIARYGKDLPRLWGAFVIDGL